MPLGVGIILRACVVEVTILVVHVLWIGILVGHVAHMFGEGDEDTINELEVDDLVAVVNEELKEIRHIADSIVKYKS